MQTRIEPMRPSSHDHRATQPGSRRSRTPVLLAGALLAAFTLSACQATPSGTSYSGKGAKGEFGKSHYGEFQKSEIYGVANQH